MKNRILICAIGAIALGGLSACSSTDEQKAVSAIAAVDSAATNLSVTEAKAEPILAAVTGSNSQVANDLSYAQGITADAEAIAPLLSGLISAIPTTSGATASAAHYGSQRYCYAWTPKGLAACHRLRIDPRDRMALAKLNARLAPAS
jgi:hypothetical protein